ncbi:ATP-dependent DNA helicase [Neisseria gonorrhoeae]|uniref:ATP-dependent DNA helicase n=1 Tax=Neisseria gonorrhoeae TaxID=485 RepID=A0A378VWZ1_NEIGO|nr:ATP-dependent DNA helicase [Neisseria gonorrhoeae]
MPQEDLKILGRKGGEPIVSKEEGRRNLADIIGRIDNLKKAARRIKPEPQCRLKDVQTAYFSNGARQAVYAHKSCC